MPIIIFDCSFTNGVGINGGAIYFDTSVSTSKQLTLSKINFINCTARKSGGFFLLFLISNIH